MSSSLYADNDADPDITISAEDPYQAVSAAVSLAPDSPEQAEALISAAAVLESQPAYIEQICPALLDNMVGSQESMLKVWVMEMVGIGLGRAKLSMEAKTSLSEKVLQSMNSLLHDPSTHIVKLAIRCFTCMLPLLFRQICITRPPPAATHAILLSAKNTIISLALSISTYPIPTGTTVAQLGTVVPVNAGVRGLAWRFVMKVLVVGTRGGSSDPRLQSKNDPNLNLCPSNHPLIKPAELDKEVNFLIEQMITTFYQQADPAILHPIINLIPPVVKSRPQLAGAFLPALASWSPNTMVAAGRPFMQIKAVEKTLKVVMVHLLRSGQHAAFQPQLTDALNRQAERITAALKEEKAARQSARAAAAAAAPLGQDLKRPAEVMQPESSATAAKRARVRSPSPQRLMGEPAAGVKAEARSAPSGPGSGDCKGVEFDVSTLDVGMANELLMAALIAVDPVTLASACERMRHLAASSRSEMMRVMSVVLGSAEDAVPPAPVVMPAPVMTSSGNDLAVRQPETDDMLLDPDSDETNIANAVAAKVEDYDYPIKEEEEEMPVADPLAMLDEDEDEDFEEDEAEELGQPTVEEEPAVEEVMPLQFLQFKLPPPEPLDAAAREKLMLTALERICISGREVQGRLSAVAGDGTSDEVEGNVDSSRVGTTLNPREMWILLLSRLASRGMVDQGQGTDGKTMGTMSARTRKVVCEFVAEDFAARSKLATCWLNEEWYNERLSGAVKSAEGSTFSIWLRSLLQAYVARMESSDKTLTRFLLDLPEISEETLGMLREMCQNPDRAIVGFTTLREIVNMRPPARASALQTLLDLTTHSDRKVRLLAINTVKRWVPDVAPMNGIVVHYALQMVRRLAQPAADEVKEEGMEEGEEVEEKVVSTFVSDVLEAPIKRDVVQQHVELLFALSVRDADLLDEIFDVYPRMDASVQEAVGVLLTPLIRSLGPSHTKLLTILRSFPSASETLALRVLSILTESGKPGPNIVALVKTLMLERDLDARFLIPIAGEMDKAEIHRYMPKMVGILCNKPAEREMVRQVFRHVVSPVLDLSQSTNVAREKTADLTAADLLVLLHDQEKEIGLKAAIEAIDICFGLTDLFTSEVFAVFMQRIIDGTTLPVLFMRTVIRAVSTYRSLGGYVSTTLLSRLITKKIWTNSQLWKGFMHCAKLIAPQSFNALLQLPREQLKDLVNNQAAIKPALWQFVVSKAGAAKAQSYADIFGDMAMNAQQAQSSQYQAIPTMS